MAEAGNRFVVHRSGGEPITDRAGRTVTLLAAHEEIAILWYRLAPGEVGPEPHVHHRHTDAFYVLDGEMTFTLGPDLEQVTAAAGTLVAAPPNLVHTFANESDGDARFLNLHAPDGGFAAYMRAVSRGEKNATFDTADPPDDGGIARDEGIFSGPGAGERLVSANRTALLKCALPDLSLLHFEVDGELGGPDPHEHERQVDSFYVLDGELEVNVSGSTHRAGPETLASVPRSVRHSFSHPSSDRVSFLNLHAPDDGFASFLRDQSE
jgi:quercetin dioxygenase-like cupin family protein